MEKWEYLVVPMEEVGGLRKKDDDLTPDRLNELGSQGWEAVGLSLKKGRSDRVAGRPAQASGRIVTGRSLYSVRRAVPWQLS